MSYVYIDRIMTLYLILFVCVLARFVTLQPGDVVLTGTPPGVGCFRKPPLFMKVKFVHLFKLHLDPIKLKGSLLPQLCMYMLTCIDICM